MLLEETTHINASPKRIFDFFSHMDEQRYLDWHPDHLAFRWVEGDAVREGNVCYFEERIYGKISKKKVRYTLVEPNGYIEFSSTQWFYRLFFTAHEFCVRQSKK